MKARRQIVDPLTGAKVPASSPVAVDTGNLIVGRGLVVDPEDRAPESDRFGITPEAQRRLAAELEDTRRVRKAPRGRGPAFQTTMGSPAAGEREFEDLNPQIFAAPGFDDLDIHDQAKDFLLGLEVQRGRGKAKPVAKTAAGKRILEASSGSAVARGVLRYLMGKAPGGRWREVPWSSVFDFTGQLAEQVGSDPSTIAYPIAAGLDPPDVVLARAREELGPTAAAKVARTMNAEELRSLAERYERAVQHQGEECLSGEAVRIAKERISTLRRWARNPDLVPDWSCVGTEQTEGIGCSFPGLLEDVRRLERSCEVDYDPAWPVEHAEAACAKAEEEGRTGLLGKPCAVRKPHARVPRIIAGRLVR